MGSERRILELLKFDLVQAKKAAAKAEAAYDEADKEWEQTLMKLSSCTRDELDDLQPKAARAEYNAFSKSTKFAYRSGKVSALEAAIATIERIIEETRDE